jgi:type I restriction enzyme S subunit
MSSPPGWSWVALTDVARMESGHTPSRKKPEYWDGDIPWLSVSEATRHHGEIIHDTTEHVSQAGIDNSSARILPAHTVCLSRTASLGFVVALGRPMATSQGFANWVCSDALNWRYLLYLLTAEQSSMPLFAGGSAHQTIYYPELKALRVCLPPLAEQETIVHVLAALDEKVESNRRIAAASEDLAAGLFRSWFVDFDPVSAHAEGGRPVGVPRDAASLFPTSFEHGAGAPTPAGWTRGHLGDWARVDRGVAYRSADLDPDADVGLVGLKAIRAGGGYAARGIRGFTGPYTQSHVLNDGDIVVAHTDLTQAGDVIGSSARIPRIEDYSTLLASQDLGTLRAEQAWISGAFLYALTCLPAFRRHARARSSGTTVLHLPRTAINELPVVMPPPEVVRLFDEVAAPLYARADQAQAENRALTALRGDLLPQLIAGRLRVGAVEELVGE